MTLTQRKPGPKVEAITGYKSHVTGEVYDSFALATRETAKSETGDFLLRVGMNQGMVNSILDRFDELVEIIEPIFAE